MGRRRRGSLFRVLPGAGDGVLRTTDGHWFRVGDVVELPHLSDEQVRQLVARGVVEPVEQEEEETHEG